MPKQPPTSPINSNCLSHLTAGPMAFAIIPDFKSGPTCTVTVFMDMCLGQEAKKYESTTEADLYFVLFGVVCFSLNTCLNVKEIVVHQQLVDHAFSILNLSYMNRIKCGILHSLI
ncbi:hypothetical protein XELAEV_18047200mg [Xenopus laevis]|uniref:Uncharacterized protein n=1 Tax=Xenopus laevis TaxID=8355 RepID=A0A974BV10_XENLA|nr:hypothetical protein XELAEV_18047200mg [Xenopus laevis]